MSDTPTTPRVATKRGDVFEIELSGTRAVYLVLGFYTDCSIEALRVFPDSMRVAKKPTKVPRSAAQACTLPAHKLDNVLALSASYHEASLKVLHVEVTGNRETIAAATDLVRRAAGGAA